MFGSGILDVAIGMIFIYLLLSLICSAVNELIEAKLKNRATDLERGILSLLEAKPDNQTNNAGQDNSPVKTLFDRIRSLLETKPDNQTNQNNQSNNAGQDDNLVKKLYDHPLVSGLFEGAYKAQPIKWRSYWKGTNLPSYIPARNFALALMDIVLKHPASSDTSGQATEDTGKPETPTPTPTPSSSQTATPTPTPATPGRTATGAASGEVTLQELRAALDNFTKAHEKAGKAISSLIDTTAKDIEEARVSIEGWFNSSMDRVSGWYKRRTQVILLVLGLLVTIFINVNSITIANHLSRDSALRSALVSQADAIAKQQNAPAANLDKDLSQLEGLGLPIGWGKMEFKNVGSWNDIWNYVVYPWLGWLITAAAISFGAPFWFDLLNQFMVVRSTVKPHEKSPEEGSADRKSARK